MAEYKRGGRIRTPHEYIAFLDKSASETSEKEGQGEKLSPSYAAAWLRGNVNTWVSSGAYSFLPISQKGAPGDCEEVSGTRSLEPGERLVVGNAQTLIKLRQGLEGGEHCAPAASSEAETAVTDAPSAGRSSFGAEVSTATVAAQLEMAVEPGTDAAVSTAGLAGTRVAGEAQTPLHSLLSSLARETDGEPLLLVAQELRGLEEPVGSAPSAGARRVSPGAGAAGGRIPRASALRGLSSAAEARSRILGKRGSFFRWLLPTAGLVLLVGFAVVIWPALRGERTPVTEDISEAPEPVTSPTSQAPTETPIRAPGGELPRSLTLSSKWKRTLKGAVTSSPTVAEGRVYFGCRDGNLYCLDSESGEQIWKFGAGAGIGSSPAVANGSVFVGNYDGRLFSVDAASGNKKWEFKTAGKIVSSPCVVSGRVLFGSYDRNLYCLSAHDGKLLWKHETAGIVWSSPTVGKDRVFFGSTDGSFFCLSLDSGRQYWRKVAPGGVYSSPAVEGTVVCFGSIGRAFHFLDVSDGSELFKVNAGGEVRSSPILSEQTAYVAADDGVVTCISVREKGVNWTFEAKREIRSRPFLSDGLLLVTSYDGRLYALEASSGIEIGSFNAGAEIYSSPTVWDDKVYFGTNSGDFYCLQPERPSP
jgi:outer membrane protein assembly factor BamB